MSTIFSTDHYFHIGEWHSHAGKPCQDHALSEVGSRSAFISIADGCSSGKETDIGARILNLSTLAALREETHSHENLSEVGAGRIAMRQELLLEQAGNLLGLKEDDLLATCLHAALNEDGGYVSVQGDGVVAIKFHDGRLLLRRFEWANNMPFYPAYRSRRLQDFISAHGGDVDALRFSETIWTGNGAGGWEQETVLEHRIRDGIEGIVIPLARGEEIEFVALFSDGVTQMKELDWKEAVCRFTAFKSTAGEFLKRRMIRAIGESERAGGGPLDDIACAIIRSETKKQTEEKT
ncbi:MAG: protein phosphatase 2C domain-containing protein [Candidatus Moranbacteria bacterium]|nr:protein phosphatase 2C domain-containing protein [Candidatus Moranbacteria bacterium]